MNKIMLRKETARLRKNLHIKSYEQIFASLEIILQARTVRTVHIYKSSTALNEVDTNKLVSWLHTRYPGVVILQPDASPDAPMFDGLIDVTIVPTVAFDSTGNRIGMGSGWYDRFLKLHSESLIIGLAYDECEVQKIEPEPHDVRLDYVVTQTRLLNLHKLE